MGWALFTPQFQITSFHELIKEWPIEMNKVGTFEGFCMVLEKEAEKRKRNAEIIEDLLREPQD